jgi:hypothetical protein
MMSLLCVECYKITVISSTSCAAFSWKFLAIKIKPLHCPETSGNHLPTNVATYSRINLHQLEECKSLKTNIFFPIGSSVFPLSKIQVSHQRAVTSCSLLIFVPRWMFVFSLNELYFTQKEKTLKVYSGFTKWKAASGCKPIQNLWIIQFGSEMYLIEDRRFSCFRSPSILFLIRRNNSVKGLSTIRTSGLYLPVGAYSLLTHRCYEGHTASYWSRTPGVFYSSFKRQKHTGDHWLLSNVKYKNTFISAYFFNRCCEARKAT